MNNLKKLALPAAALLAAACGGGAKTAPPPAPTPAPEPAPAPAPEPAPAPTPPPPPTPSKADTQQKLVDRYLECQRAGNAKEAANLAACYTDTAELAVSDSPEKSVGGEKIAAAEKDAWTGFPDLAYRSPVILVNGEHMAVVLHAFGMNTGKFMGGKPTGRTVGVNGMRLIDWSGDKIVKETDVYDPTALMSQLGKVKGIPARKAENPPQGEPKVVLATDSKEENDNVAVVKTFCDGYNKHDASVLTGTLADDVEWSDQTSPADIKGKAGVEKEVTAILKAFPDISATCEAWGAGPFVVSYTAWTATNKTAWPEVGIKKATNKQVNVHDAELFLLDGGKIKNYWRFSNGMAMAIQLGLMKPPAAPKPAKPKTK